LRDHHPAERLVDHPQADRDRVFLRQPGLQLGQRHVGVGGQFAPDRLLVVRQFGWHVIHLRPGGGLAALLAAADDLRHVGNADFEPPGNLL
jgi:hypothetical protein